MTDERSQQRTGEERLEVTTRMPVWLKERLVHLAHQMSSARGGKITLNALICELCETAVLDEKMLERQAEQDRERALALMERALELAVSRATPNQEVAA